MFGDFNERISAIDIISKYYLLQIFVTKYKKKILENWKIYDILEDVFENAD